ncbi:endonuclease/exonuclease/phosphatase family protein [Paraliomyxa miuraensis]|uniref:endonuclease/exonuclease/phosphatase family protein n=1 Tax=Paraliomyxa miuraensis TaxID=376150 RepID=UPI002258E49B|nr:endonuclease/exonuclease/phosphatase family protein [Paraliomyxa miuraensis]MCX4243124.1 endonuclease/exonuclease/phosphatase family protein [Paraliomyxa miuraensis]
MGSIVELTGRERARARRRRWAEECAREAPVRPKALVRRIDHALGEELRRWSSLPSRAAIERDEGYRLHRAQVQALLHGFQWDLRQATATATARPGRLRAAAWNVERGKRWQALCGVLQEHPGLQDLDVMLLTEVDHGMGRSGNRDVAAMLGQHLGMGHVFVNSHLVLSPGDHAEQDHGVPNTLALHGSALLTRFPVRRVLGVGLPEYGDKLHALERRLGAKRAVLVELDAPGGVLTVAVVHLDPFSSPAHRARQMRRVMESLRELDGRHVLLGGDFNTNTYDLGSLPRLCMSLGRKMLRYGFAGTIAHYMIPDQQLERPVFDVLAQSGLTTEGFVDRDTDTIRFDLNDPEYLDKAQRMLPRPLFSWLQRRVEPWNGAVPMRMDWLAGRGVVPRRAWTVTRPRFRGEHVSDHDPIGVELAWAPPAFHDPR